jgi:hypothetical protein
MNFFKAYMKVCKTNIEFYKKHWFAMLCINAVAAGATISLAMPKEVRKDIVTNIKDKFKR